MSSANSGTLKKVKLFRVCMLLLIFKNWRKNPCLYTCTYYNVCVCVCACVYEVGQVQAPNTNLSPPPCRSDVHAHFVFSSQPIQTVLALSITVSSPSTSTTFPLVFSALAPLRRPLLLLYLLLYLFLLKSQSSSFASRLGRAGRLFLGFY